MQNKAIIYRLYGSSPAGVDERPPLRPTRIIATVRADLCDDCGWPDLCRQDDACQRGAQQGKAA